MLNALISGTKVFSLLATIFIELQLQNRHSYYYYLSHAL